MLWWMNKKTHEQSDPSVETAASDVAPRRKRAKLPKQVCVRPRFFRPSLEELCQRVMPATLVWNPVFNNLANNPFNWSTPAGVRANAIPTAVDDVAFNAFCANADCIWNLGTAVKSVTMTPGYGLFGPAGPLAGRGAVIALQTDMDISANLQEHASGGGFSKVNNFNPVLRVDPAGGAATVSWDAAVGVTPTVAFASGVQAIFSSAGNNQFNDFLLIAGNVTWKSGNIGVNRLIVNAGGTFDVQGNMNLGAVGGES